MASHFALLIKASKSTVGDVQEDHCKKIEEIVELAPFVLSPCRSRYTDRHATRRTLGDNIKVFSLASQGYFMPLPSNTSAESRGLNVFKKINKEVCFCSKDGRGNMSVL